MLVVDFQTAFTDPKYPLGGLPMIHAARDRTAQLLEAARARKVPVAACYTAYGSLADMPLWKVKAVRDEFYHGHSCTAVDRRSTTRTTSRTAGTAVDVLPDLADHVPVRQTVDTVIAAGCTTSGCVRATVVDAFSYGFRVLVAEDCCGDADEAPHRSNLADVGRRYADILKTAEVEAYLAALPA